MTLAPGLYLVATPIGNLGDITLRALDVLRAVDLIACEDTRVTGKLLAHFGIRARTMSYNDHNGDKQRPLLLAELAQGRRVALVSDAGTPLISDPGYKLMREAIGQGSKVIPIPGASSVMAALCLAGLPTDRFLFAGFLPAKTGARERAIEEIKPVSATLVFFEAPRRLAETLEVLSRILGPREAVIARELTKLFEEARRGTLPELAAYYASSDAPKGEAVIVIGPPCAGEAPDEEQLDALLREALRTGSVKDAAAEVAKASGLPRKDIYARALLLAKTKRS